MKININDNVTVELTEYGKRVLIKKYPRAKLDGMLFRTALWDLMHIFGQEIRFSVQEMCFRNNVIDVELEKQEPVEDLRTSDEWQKLCKIEVLDPDGWDRKNFEYSWGEEKISREEFKKRLMISTVQGNLNAINSGKIWKDRE